MRILIRDILHKVPLFDALFRRFIWSRIHFPESELELLNKSKNATFDVGIDVGGALGSYAFMLSRKSKQVICLEPGDYHYNFLKWAAIFSNIKILKLAVGSHSGISTLFIPGNDTNARHSATVSKNNPIIESEGTVEHNVELISLDEAYEKFASSGARVDIIKIDVEGYENEVLKGAANIISQFHPIVIAEIELRHNPEYKFFFDSLAKLGYQAYAMIDGKYERVSTDQIVDLQSDDRLNDRLCGLSLPEHNRYINNFVFQNEQSKVKLI